MINENIKIFNSKTGEIKDAMLFYKEKSTFNYYLKIIFDDTIEEYISDNYFQALKMIRIKIYPWIPMIKGALINAVSRGTKIVYIVELGKQSRREDVAFIFEESLDKLNLVHPTRQEVFQTIWFNSLNSVSKEYNISNEYICIEKIPKYNFIYNENKEILEKIENKNYLYFWLYSITNGKVFDIKNLEDLKKFKNNQLKEKWNSLKEFLLSCPNKLLR